MNITIAPIFIIKLCGGIPNGVIEFKYEYSSLKEQLTRIQIEQLNAH